MDKKGLVFVDNFIADKHIKNRRFFKVLFFPKQNTWNRNHIPETKETYVIGFYRACALQLHRDVSIDSWCASLIRLERVGTKQHTAEVGYFWLISTLHPHTS